jgi:hypothetical protein
MAVLGSPNVFRYLGSLFCRGPIRPGDGRHVSAERNGRAIVAAPRMMEAAAMAKSSTARGKGSAAGRNHQQKGKQQGHNTGKEAWKSNLEDYGTEPRPSQTGQRPRKGEAFGSTPGEVRGHPGGKRGQAMGGQRGTARSMKAKTKRAAKKAAK